MCIKQQKRNESSFEKCGEKLSGEKEALKMWEM